MNKLVNDFMELETEELQDDGFIDILYGLNLLVEPLAWTKPGQTVVFSRYGNLHCIPLYALKIDGEVIIKRNPVVYCSRLSAWVATYRLRTQVEPFSSPLSTADVYKTEKPVPFPR